MVPPPVRLTVVVALASLPLFDFNGVPQTRRSDAGAGAIRCCVESFRGSVLGWSGWLVSPDEAPDLDCDILANPVGDVLVDHRHLGSGPAHDVDHGALGDSE